MSVLIFSDFKPSELTPNNKTAPAKAKADGKWFALGRDVQAPPLNVPLEADTSTKPTTRNGKTYDNHYLNAWKRYEPPTSQTAGNGAVTLVPAASPALPEKISRSRAEPISGTRDNVQALIVWQSSLARAVEILGPGKEPREYASLADWFVAHAFKEAAYDVDQEVNRVAGGSTDALVGSAGPSQQQAAPSTPSPAQAALEAAKQKAADRRAAYDPSTHVCGGCGFKEHLVVTAKGNVFCDKKAGGCGYPAFGTRDDKLWTYGEWLQQYGGEAALRRPDAPVVSPSTHPTTR